MDRPDGVPLPVLVWLAVFAVLAALTWVDLPSALRLVARLEARVVNHANQRGVAQRDALSGLSKNP
jgi:hypothetical protein